MSGGEGSLRRTALLRVAFLASVLSLLLVLMMSANAFAAFGGGSADNGSPPPTTNPGTSNPPSNGGGSSGGGQSKWKYWTFNSIAVAPGVPQQGCAASNSSGGLFVAVKFKYRYPSNLGLTGVQNAIRSGDAAMRELGIERLEHSCLYDGSWKDETVRCVISSTATATMIVPRSVTLATRTTQSAYGAGDRSIAACKASKTQAYVEVVPDVYGRYHIAASSQVVSLVVRTPAAANGLTGVWEEPRVISESAPYTTNPFAADGYLTCEGWFEGVPTRQYTWTANDCVGGPEDEGSFRCLIGGDPLISWRGETWRGRDAQLLRDGSDVTLAWDAPTIAGSGLQQIVSTRSRMAVSNAPWSTQKTIAENFFGLQRDSARQNALTGPDGTAWKTGLTSTWTSQVYVATDSLMTMTPQYGFTADFLKQSVRIKGLDESGRFITEPITTVVRADASCSGQPLNISTLRVVNN